MSFDGEEDDFRNEDIGAGETELELADDDYDPDLVNSFLYAGNAQVGTLIISDHRELMCAYSNVFGDGVKPDLELLDPYFNEGCRLALVVTRRYDDMEGMRLTSAMPSQFVGEDEEEIIGEEPNFLEWTVKLLDANEQQDLLDERGISELDDGTYMESAADDDDDGIHLPFDNSVDDTEADVEGPAHRVMLYALPPGIENVRVYVIEPGDPKDEPAEDDALEDMPGTFTMKMAVPPQIKAAPRTTTAENARRLH